MIQASEVWADRFVSTLTYARLVTIHIEWEASHKLVARCSLTCECGAMALQKGSHDLIRVIRRLTIP